jgi:hypothetical protein
MDFKEYISNCFKWFSMSDSACLAIIFLSAPGLISFNFLSRILYPSAYKFQFLYSTFLHAKEPMNFCKDWEIMTKSLLPLAYAMPIVISPTGIAQVSTYTAQTCMWLHEKYQNLNMHKLFVQSVNHHHKEHNFLCNHLFAHADWCLVWAP